MAERAFSSSACSSALAILIGGRTYAEGTTAGSRLGQPLAHASASRWLTSRPAGSLEARLSARSYLGLPKASASLGKLLGRAGPARLALIIHIVAGRRLRARPARPAWPAEQKLEWKQAMWQPPVRAGRAES